MTPRTGEGIGQPPAAVVLLFDAFAWQNCFFAARYGG